MNPTAIPLLTKLSDPMQSHTEYSQHTGQTSEAHTQITVPTNTRQRVEISSRTQ